MSVYSKAINKSRAVEEEVTEPISTEQKVVFQIRSDWIRNPRTQEIFAEVHAEIDKLESEARQLATTYPQHNNSLGVIHRLVRAEELRKLLTTYGRVDSQTT